MKKYTIYIKKYFPFIILLVIGIIIFSVKGPRQPGSVGIPAKYLTEKQKFIEVVPLDSSIGKNISDIEETTPELVVKNKEPPRAGLTQTYLYDNKNAITFQTVSDETGKILAISRTPLSEPERDADSLMRTLGVGAPEGVMYPKGAIMGTAYVYPSIGVAFVFNIETRQVHSVINFEIMSLTQFKQMFSTVYQDTPDKSAY